MAYAISQLNDRGKFFVKPGEFVYAGMIVGEYNRDSDLTINICKTKKLTNMRASGSDDALKISPPRSLTLEQAIEYINDDELVEVTPKSIRLRKKILTKIKENRSAKRKRS